MGIGCPPACLTCPNLSTGGPWRKQMRMTMRHQQSVQRIGRWSHGSWGHGQTSACTLQHGRMAASPCTCSQLKQRGSGSPLWRRCQRFRTISQIMLMALRCGPDYGQIRRTQQPHRWQFLKIGGLSTRGSMRTSPQTQSVGLTSCSRALPDHPGANGQQGLQHTRASRATRL